MLDEHDSNEPRPLSLSRKKALIETYINQKILYKEAYRLGLHEYSLIRDRLIQKARFYLDGQFSINSTQSRYLRSMPKGCV